MEQQAYIIDSPYTKPTGRSVDYDIDLRLRIAATMQALKDAGISGRAAVQILEEKYKFDTSGGVLSKASCTDIEKIANNNYHLTSPVLRNILHVLVVLCNDESSKNPAKSKTIADSLLKKGHTLAALEQYTIGSTDFLVLQPDAIVKNDWVLRWFKEPSSLMVMLVAIAVYWVLPYTIAMATGVWNGTDHPFSDSNAVLLGYPIFAVSMFSIHLFYKEIPKSFNAFANQIHLIEAYKTLLRTNFGYLKTLSLLLGAVSLALSIYLHIHYLYDGKYGYLESSAGVPSLLFFINIPLFGWQMFIFIYTLATFGLILESIRTLSKNANSASQEMLKGKVLTIFLKPIAKLAKTFSFITIFAIGYGVAYFTGVNNFSKKHSILTEWHRVEMLIMFIPLAIYLAMYSYYVYLLYRMTSDLDHDKPFMKRFLVFMEKINLY